MEKSRTVFFFFSLFATKNGFQPESNRSEKEEKKMELTLTEK